MTQTNAHEFTVSELAGSLKRTVEENYGHVRVRGELGRVTIAGSGHIYMDLKDDKAVISSIVWKGVAGRLSFRPEEGLEVIAEGKLTTYPGRSQYQLVITQLEPAGAGALMALLAERKKKLTTEGLFAETHKQSLPFLPEVIGVITSPTGAVIRDILHRLEDRFPRHVLLWPVLVQGDKAAAQITTAINGFHEMSADGDIPRPDLLIIARGGGSVEDLWPFNEEEVVRAAHACSIPLISAIGHETDWSLLDLVADVRAPTPTGAAEMAVPVRADLIASLDESALRLKAGLRRLIEARELALTSAKRGLPKPEELLAAVSQRFDYIASRLGQALIRRVECAEQAVHRAIAGLRPKTLQTGIIQREALVSGLAKRVNPAMERLLAARTERLYATRKILGALSHKSVLGRGFALVRGDSGQLVTRAAGLQSAEHVSLEFIDGKKIAVIGEGAKAVRPAGRKAKAADPEQGDLF
ncbi:MAG: exodeoxyribonuclease VII large subunit [Robiginitomaculum sp.]|nr:exodeoxyribonuclease VII large subunit [Robiginitomaculum sp.]